MKKKTEKVEEIRAFLMALDVQLVSGGLMISRIRFKRDEEGNCTGVLIDYEQRDSETGDNNIQEGAE